MKQALTMKVPLQAYSMADKIKIVQNGQQYVVDAPMLPYVLIEKGQTFDESDTVETYKDFSGKRLNLYKFEFNEYSQFNDFRMKTRESRSFSLPAIEEVYVDHPDFFKQYPNTSHLKVMALDIEVLSDGSGIFPRASENPIIAIGVKIDDDEVVIFDDLRGDATSDKYILQQFFDFIREADPDIIVTYNGGDAEGRGFDIPYILERARRHRLPIDSLGRWPTGVNPFFGRINYDVYIDVMKDQAPQLLNLKNRKMETVVHHFTGIKPASIDAGNTASYLQRTESGLKLNDEIRKYLISDVNSTKIIFDIYIHNNIALAEFLGLPLDAVINVENSFVPKIYYIRGLKALGYLAVDSNVTRYPDFQGKFQAAIVKINHRCPECKNILYLDTCINADCRFHQKVFPPKQQIKAGRFDQVHKLDFAAYYANTMKTFNLSPETTRFIKSYPYDASIYPLKVEKIKEGVFHLHVPDQNYNQTLVIEVDMGTTGFLKKELIRLHNERSLIKKKIKQLAKEGVPEDSPEMRVLESQQNAYKLVGNKCYGYNGLKYSKFGDMMVAIGIVALCRWMTLTVDNWLKNKIVEIDTDGFILHQWDDRYLDRLNKKLAALIKDTFGIEENYIELEHDPMQEAFFYKMKSYVVKLPKGEISKHGAALKSSRHPKVYDHAIDKLIQIILAKEEVDWFEIVNQLKNFQSMPLSYFVLRSKVNKELDEYATDKAIALKLSAQVMEDTNRQTKPGDQIEYIVTKGKQYTLSSRVKSVSEIDNEYYNGVVDKALEIFDVPTNPGQLSLF